MAELKKPFWGWVFAEADGTPSLSRIATAVLVAFTMGWVTHLVWKNNALPDFAGLALLIGTLYGLNRGADFLNNWKGQPPQDGGK